MREFRGRVREAPVTARAGDSGPPSRPRPVPGWLGKRAPIEARPPRPLAPSSLGEDLVGDPPPSPAMRAAAERGRLLHALFERLPSVAPERRGEAAERWLAGAGGVTDAAARAEIATAALAVTEDPRFAELFGENALAEAPIAAVVEGVVVSGTVDRLVVAPDRVRVIDFKTGRRAPDTLADVPIYHLRQMGGLCRGAGRDLPDRAIEAALLYSAGPVLYPLPPELLAAHKPGLFVAEQSLTSGA